jgi:hypothetical protein
VDVAGRATASHSGADWLIVSLEIDVRVLARVREIRVRHSDLTQAVTTQESAAPHIPVSRSKEINCRIQGVVGRHVRAVAQILYTAWN